MWLALVSLRESVNPTPDSTSSLERGTLLYFPDPLPPPSSTVIHNTRNMRNAGTTSSVQVAISAQMVPVIYALIDAAADTDLVREELENGMKEGKEITREVKECIKKENDEWDTERKRLEESMKKSKPAEGSADDQSKVLSKEVCFSITHPDSSG